MRRYAANRDRGEAAIVAALRAVGARVLQLNEGRAGVPDLLVGFGSRLTLLEVKDPIGPQGGSKRDGQTLSQAQIAFHRIWMGYCEVVRSPEEALLAIHAISKEDARGGL